MDQRQIAGGTRNYFGAPATPMPGDRSAAIADLVARVPGVVEAHLPQCFIEGEPGARQVLAIVVSTKEEIPRVCNAIGHGLKGILPEGQFLDILPFRQTSVIPGVREARCQIYPSNAKAWWKVW